MAHNNVRKFAVEMARDLDPVVALVFVLLVTRPNRMKIDILGDTF